MSDVARERLFTPASLARLHEVADVVTDDAEVLLTGWGSPPVDEAALAAAPRLRAIVHAAGSAKRLVTPACWARGIAVSTAADANAQPVAEYTLAAILLANKAWPLAARGYRARRAHVDALTELPGVGNYGKTVGVIGASRVGRRVIELLQPFALTVLVADPYLDAPVPGAELRELDDLL